MYVYLIKLLMILSSQHSHPVTDISKAPIIRKRKEVFDAKKETDQYFQQELANSKKIFNEKSITRLTTLRKDSEDKVYANLQESTHGFLAILVKDRNSKIEEKAKTLQKQLKARQREIVKDISSQSMAIQRKKSIRDIQKELQEKLQIMRSKAPTNSLNQQEIVVKKRREQIKEQNYLQFRRESYWKAHNQKNQSIVSFIKSMQSDQKKQRERHRSAIQLTEKKRIQQQMQLKKQEQQKHMKERMEVHQKYQVGKIKRQKEIEQFNQKIKQTQLFLAKFKHRIPPHLLFTEEEKKRQAQEEQKITRTLNELREKRRQLSLSEIHESLKRYEEQKQKHAQQLQQRKMVQLQEERLVKSRLNRLYKSRIRADSAEKQVDLSSIHTKQRKEKAMKMLVYSQKIKQKYAPKVDPQKREQLLKSIEDLKAQNKMRKIRDGQLILINKNILNPRQMGLRYLEQVKQFTSSIERKPSAPPPQKGIKIIDRSKLKNTFYNKHITITNWKQIMQSERLNAEEKEVRLQNYFKLIEEQRSKSLALRKGSSLSKSIDLQRKIDHYQLQKASAKLALLKSMM